MKRFWIGIGILSVLLIFGVIVTWAMWTIHTPISTRLQAAQKAAMENNWEEATRLAAISQQQWKKWYSVTAAFADHGPMEEISSLFAELDVYASEQDSAHFAALCGNLSQLAEAMADSHIPTWWNLL